MIYLLSALFLLFSFIGSMILTWLYIAAINRHEGVCCHHKPEHVHSTATYYSYLECKKCGERSFKSSENIYVAEDKGAYVNVPWLCGQDRIL